MEQLVLTICAQMMSEADVLNSQSPVPWYDLFFALDKDEDGRLSFGELFEGLKALVGAWPALDERQLDGLVRALDLDCSGYIEWVEWTAVSLLSMKGYADPEPLTTVFRLLDRPSGDGIVGAADLLAVISNDTRGACVPQSTGREEVLRIINRWLPRGGHDKKREGRGHAKGGGGVVSPPSLRLSDLRRVLDNVDRDGNEARLTPRSLALQRGLCG